MCWVLVGFSATGNAASARCARGRPFPPKPHLHRLLQYRQCRLATLFLAFSDCTAAHGGGRRQSRSEPCIEQRGCVQFCQASAAAGSVYPVISFIAKHIRHACFCRFGATTRAAGSEDSEAPCITISSAVTSSRAPANAGGSLTVPWANAASSPSPVAILARAYGSRVTGAPFQCSAETMTPSARQNCSALRSLRCQRAGLA